VDVEQPYQHEVDEEPLDPVLLRRQLAILQIGADDRHVVGQIP